MANSTAITRAIVTRGPAKSTPWKVENISLRPLAKTELLVRVVATGICHTDLLISEVGHVFGGYPRILGHEGAGYVEDIGAGVTVAKRGDPVILSFASCRACGLCSSEHPAHCTRFSELNFVGSMDFSVSSSGQQEPSIRGSFFGQSSFSNLTITAESSIVNVSGLVHSSDELILFAPLGCGVQTGSGSITNVANAGPGDAIAVMGLGGVGLSVIMAAKIRGCKVIIGIDRVENRTQLAQELGATHVINTTATGGDMQKLIQCVFDQTDGRLGTTITIDTTGVLPLIEAGIAFTAPRGHYIQIGSPAPGTELSVPLASLIVSGKSITGTIEGDTVSREYIPQMIQWYREGKLPLEKLVKKFEVEDFQLALEEMADGLTVKPVLVW
ncbi:aryl-alcohol dehydrogenase [Paracoccidioides lutzii Pb01]|uniref:Aryl-alcohol dehydrogenase n=1 Tax=Paracoccidioides lutzii (strain ATCC MYA-826 / Pb01) TaxID=502779 RepID=C1H384_PARBA|nr:aryl-alcohol dehydrogenase [Paracoccidioides lutzii Pb01]EEH34178.1 aryl-alcohol dehydrogenase [Paracoccidioides lutzii Pb01]